MEALLALEQETVKGQPAERPKNWGRRRPRGRFWGNIKVLKGCCIPQGIQSMTHVVRANIHSEKTWEDPRLAPPVDLWASNNRSEGEGRLLGGWAGVERVTSSQPICKGWESSFPLLVPSI